jgi:hypothetical protein
VVHADSGVLPTYLLEAVTDGMRLWSLAAAGLADSPAGLVWEMNITKFSCIFDGAAWSVVRWLCHGA